MAGNVEPWHLLYCWIKQAVEQTIDLVVIRDAMDLMWRDCHCRSRIVMTSTGDIEMMATETCCNITKCLRLFFFTYLHNGAIFHTAWPEQREIIGRNVENQKKNIVNLSFSIDTALTLSKWRGLISGQIVNETRAPPILLSLWRTNITQILAT